MRLERESRKMGKKRRLFQAMKSLVSVSALTIALLAQLPPANAQVGPVGLIQMPPLFGEFKPAEGSWVEYKVHETDSDTVMNITVALLSREKCNTANTDDKKRDCYWVEVVTQLIDGPSAAVKIYSAGDPRDVKNFRRLLNRAGKRPPVEALPASLSKLEKIPGGEIPGNARTNPKKDTVTAGSEKLPATVSEFRSDGIPYVLWTSDRVPLFGMAKLQAPNLKIELLGYGRNFKTTFPEVKEMVKKENVIEKPAPVEINKPGKNVLDEDKGKLNEDYKRPGREGGENEPGEGGE